MAAMYDAFWPIFSTMRRLMRPNLRAVSVHVGVGVVLGRTRLKWQRQQCSACSKPMPAREHTASSAPLCELAPIQAAVFRGPRQPPRPRHPAATRPLPRVAAWRRRRAGRRCRRAAAAAGTQVWPSGAHELRPVADCCRRHNLQAFAVRQLHSISRGGPRRCSTLQPLLIVSAVAQAQVPVLGGGAAGAGRFTAWQAGCLGEDAGPKAQAAKQAPVPSSNQQGSGIVSLALAGEHASSRARAVREGGR